MALLEEMNSVQDCTFVVLFTRDADRIRPSEKMHAKDGSPLYWLPLMGFDLSSGRNFELTAFSREPLAVNMLDVIDFDGYDLLRTISTRNGAIGMYDLHNVRIVGNLLTPTTGGKHE